MSETILKVEDLKTSFMTSSGEVQAVRGVSFEVHKGEILGIVGESGSGKSVCNWNCQQKILCIRKKIGIVRGTTPT